MPSAKVASGRVASTAGVDQHQPRLVERADQVFALGKVYARLAADRGIHLRQQGGRNLAQRDAAQKGGGCKAGDVSHHAAAKGDDEVLARHSGRKQVMVDTLDRGEPFVFFARGNDRVELTGKVKLLRASFSR